MAGIQGLIITIELVVLLSLFIPCVAGNVHLRWSPQQTWRQNTSSILLLIIAFVLFYAMWNLVTAAQTINPLCIGLGDPSGVFCTGQKGLVSPYEAGALMAREFRHDILRCVLVPAVIGIGVVTLLLRRYWPRA